MDRGGGGVVLIVEDLAEVREVLASFLEEAGYRVVQAANGAQALNYLRSHPAPRAIVLDLEMPVMDGRQFRRSQLADPGLARIPVLLVSGTTSPPGPELAGVPFVAKPYDSKVLLSALVALG